jgi:hypothetical protein
MSKLVRMATRWLDIFTERLGSSFRVLWVLLQRPSGVESKLVVGGFAAEDCGSKPDKTQPFSVRLG